MSRRNLILIGIVILLLIIVVGGYLYLQQSNAARTAAATRQTATLTRGELDATVSGAGNITAPQQTNLSFGAGGVPITKINVQVGDSVKAGDVLAEEDSSQLQKQLQEAKTNLASAQAKLDDLKASPTAEDIAAAQAQVNSAQANYDAAVAKLAALKAPPSATDVQAARAQVASALATYNAAVAKAGLSSDQIAVARASYEKARIALEAAQAAYDRIAWKDNAPSSAEATTLQSATIDFQSAQSSLNLAMTDINDSAVKSAEAALATAKSNLNTLLKGATADELAAQQAAVDSANQALITAKQNLQTVQAGPTQADLLAAQAAVDSAQTALDQAQHALDQSKIIAPFDGTIATVAGVVGQTATAGTTVITLVNKNDLETQISLSEVDVSQVKPGQDVQLEFDALGGRTVPGKVLSVSPLGTITQGVVNYNVNIGLTNPDPAILPGMTAQANIIIAQRPDALIAPNRAIRTQGNRRMITLLHEGQEIPLYVQTGLVNDTSTEIVSATMASTGQAVQLEEGDTVVLNATTTTGTNRGSGGFGPGPGGFIFGRAP